MTDVRTKLKTISEVFADTEMGDWVNEAICELTMMRELLEHAGCRNVECQDGVIARPVGYDEDGDLTWETEPCQFCYELREFLDEKP